MGQRPYALHSPWLAVAMPAFTYERDLLHPVPLAVQEKLHRFPHLRYDFHADQQVLVAEDR